METTTDGQSINITVNGTQTDGPSYNVTKLTTTPSTTTKVPHIKDTHPHPMHNLSEVSSLFFYKV